MRKIFLFHTCMCGDSFNACGLILKKQHLMFFYLYFGYFILNYIMWKFTHQGYGILLFLIIDIMTYMWSYLDVKKLYLALLFPFPSSLPFPFPFPLLSSLVILSPTLLKQIMIQNQVWRRKNPLLKRYCFSFFYPFSLFCSFSFINTSLFCLYWSIKFEIDGEENCRGFQKERKW